MSNKVLSHSSGRAMAHAAVCFLFWLLTVVYFECVLQIVAFGRLSRTILFTVGFGAAFAAIPALIQSFIPKRANFAVAVLLAVVLLLLYGSQMVYFFIFGTLYSVSQMKLGGDAITSFWRELLAAMWEKLPVLLLLLIPIAVLILLRIFRKKYFAPFPLLSKAALAAAAIVLYCVTILCLRIGGTGFFTNYYYYHSNDTTTDQAAERFGLLTAFRLELTATDTEEPEDYYTGPDDSTGENSPAPEVTQDPEAGNTDAPEPEEPEEPEIKYNVLNIDFSDLNKLTDDEALEALNNYFDSLTGTNQNEYTGMLADYNLIVLCAESFATAAIHPEVTPTLYKLATEGIIFNNYYNTFPNTTTDGEYALCLGLYPDGSRAKSNASFRASVNNNLVYALGNLFTGQMGVPAYGYHNYVGSYYNREQSHANMGYTMKFAHDGMYFTSAWPSSDLEMMEQSVDDYIGQEQFHAYYMTFSGHYRYDITTNNIALGNWNQVKHLDYSDPAKAYLSCHIELDKALEYLMARLEQEGIADRTAIVLAGDHFPYGLTDRQYSELIGYDIDSFTKFKSSLLFWVGGLEENIVVDEYCCNVDVLPTILNLWGFTYDSRLLAGTDVFSDGTHVAVLRDFSFFTDKIWFNANSGEVRYLVDESEIPENYVEDMYKLIKTKYNISVDILNTDYYDFVYSNLNKLLHDSMSGALKNDKVDPNTPNHPVQLE